VTERRGPPSQARVDLYWLPLGAGSGGRCVRGSGRLYEALVASRRHRPPLNLFHSALIVQLNGHPCVLGDVAVLEGVGRVRAPERYRPQVGRAPAPDTGLYSVNLLISEGGREYVERSLGDAWWPTCLTWVPSRAVAGGLPPAGGTTVTSAVASGRLRVSRCASEAVAAGTRRRCRILGHLAWYGPTLVQSK